MWRQSLSFQYFLFNLIFLPLYPLSLSSTLNIISDLSLYYTMLSLSSRRSSFSPLGLISFHLLASTMYMFHFCPFVFHFSPFMCWLSFFLLCSSIISSLKKKQEIWSWLNWKRKSEILERSSKGLGR
jgi:hypothetical protein